MLAGDIVPPAFASRKAKDFLQTFDPNPSSKNEMEHTFSLNPSFMKQIASSELLPGSFCMLTTSSFLVILAEGAIALPVTLSGGALFAS